jgi:hypothetical protein
MTAIATALAAVLLVLSAMTDFARWDYYLFAPLCALMGFSFLYLAL